MSLVSINEMEVKDLQSDLEALRELYGFLQCGGSSVVLGERSKLFLKNLLDGATKRVLETHKKIIAAAAECGVSGISCSSNMKLVRSNETMRQSSICGFQGSPSVVGSVVGSSRSGDNLANQYKKGGEAVNDFSIDVDNVVEHIESHISALRLCSKLANATKGAVPHGLARMPASVCPAVNVKEHLVKKSELSQAFEPSSDREGLESQRFGSHLVLNQSQNDLLENMTSQRRRIQHIVKSNSRLNKKIGNWNVIGMVEAGGHKQSQTTACYVHGLRVPIKHDYITKRPSMPVKMPHTIPRSTGGKESTTPTIPELGPSIPSQSAGSKVPVRPITNKKSLKHQILLEQGKSRTGILRNKILVHQQESEESTTAGTGSNDSEAYSLPSQDSAASISRRFAHAVYDESRSSTSSDYRDAGESGRLYPTRTDKPIRPANYEPEKAEGQRLGRLGRFKNKLGLIFHRHHHHHGYDRADWGDHTRTKSTRTPLHNLSHHRNRHEVDDKLRKARLSNVAVKHQVGHFHALVEGLMQHVRHHKKSKHCKGGMGWVGNEQRGHRNGKVKQLHWWQMFMRQGGVKLPNRRRVKIGFMSKKQQLKPKGT